MNELEICELLPEHAKQVAQLHITGISSGFISSLGVEFVTLLYDAIAESKDSFGYVAKKDGQVVGFASFTTNLNKLYKSVIRKKVFKFSFLLAGKMFSLRAIRKILETLFYPARIKKMDLPSAELLSIVVVEKARGQGLATKLIKRGFAGYVERGIKKLKILAAIEIKGANKLYEKLGFKVIAQIENHGVVSNVYVVPTNHFGEI